MAQTAAAINVRVAVELTPTQATPKVSSDEDFTLDTTVGGYAAATSAFSTTISDYINNSGGTFHQANYVVRVANVTGAEPEYSEQPWGLEQENRTDGTFGKDDLASSTVSGANIKTVLDAAIATAVAKTNY